MAKKTSNKSMLMILLLMLIGAIIGVFIGFFLGVAEMKIFEVYAVIHFFLIENIHIVQLIIGIFFLITAAYFYMSAKMIYKNFHPESDDEHEMLDNKFDRHINIALISTSIYYIISFIVYAYSLDKKNHSIILSTVIFIGLMIIAAFFEIIIMKLFQKKDPSKKGDIASFKFSEDYLESCDEAEQFLIYKAGYKSFKCMNVVYVGVFVLTLLSKSFFAVSNFAVVFIGLLWLIHTMSYVFSIEKTNGRYIK